MHRQKHRRTYSGDFKMKGKMYPLILTKRALHFFPQILFLTLLTFSVILVCVSSIYGGDAKNKDTAKISVGIVGDTSTTHLNMGIDIIRNIDDSRFYIDLITMTSEEAEENLENGNIAGYVVIPDGFIDGISSMDNTPAVYYLPDSPETLGTVLTKEVVETVADYIKESQKAVSGLWHFIKSNRLSAGRNLDEISIRLMTGSLLPRNRLYTLEYTGMTDSLSVGSYYTAAFLLVFIMLSGIPCCPLLYKKDLSVQKLLFSRGIGCTRQILCEYAVYTALTIAILIILSLLFCLFGKDLSAAIPELSPLGSYGFTVYIIRIIPVILSVCAMHIFIYEAVRGLCAAILLQFASGVILGYLSGCFYPDYFFPESVRFIAGLLPSGAGFAFMRSAFSGSVPFMRYVLPLLYTAVFTALSVLLRRKRTESDTE